MTYLELLKQKEKLTLELKEVNAQIAQHEADLVTQMKDNNIDELDLGDNNIFIKTTTNTIDTNGVFKYIEDKIQNDPVAKQVFEKAMQDNAKVSYNRSNVLKQLKEQLDSETLNMTLIIKEAEKENTTSKEVYKHKELK